jgi:hypothetical protein
MASSAAKKAAEKAAKKAGMAVFAKHMENYEPADPYYEVYVDKKGREKRRKVSREATLNDVYYTCIRTARDADHLFRLSPCGSAFPFPLAVHPRLPMILLRPFGNNSQHLLAIHCILCSVIFPRGYRNGTQRSSRVSTAGPTTSTRASTSAVSTLGGPSCSVRLRLLPVLSHPRS